MLSEISQTEKDKYCMISLISRLLKINYVYQKASRLTDIENKFVNTNGAEGRGNIRGREVGDTNYWVEDGLKDVPDNTGNIDNTLL